MKDKIGDILTNPGILGGSKAQRKLSLRSKIMGYLCNDAEYSRTDALQITMAMDISHLVAMDFMNEDLLAELVFCQFHDRVMTACYQLMNPGFEVPDERLTAQCIDSDKIMPSIISLTREMSGVSASDFLNVN